MRTNVVFSSYRRETNVAERQYSSSATITNGAALLMPAPGELKAILDYNHATKIFTFSSNMTDFERYDKITVSAPSELAGDYFVEQLERISVNGHVIYRLILKQNG